MLLLVSIEFIIESSYRRYISLIDQKIDREFLENKQATGEIALSIGIDKAFYA